MIKKAMREAYGLKLVELGQKNQTIVVLDADLSGSTKTNLFQKQFPDRHFNMGIAECNMLLFASGMSIAGKTVFASSFAMFAAGRAWEIVRNTIAHDKLNVKIVATHAGISVGEDGGSHQANEDIAIMRAIPNMRVLCPADAYETGQIIEYASETEGPFYIRLTRDSSPVFLEERKTVFNPEKALVLEEGKEICIISTGLMTYTALMVQELLKSKNIFASVIHLSSIKPLDEKTLLQSVQKAKLVVVCEEHSIIGGLGSAVAECLSEKSPKKITRIGIPDVFGQSGKSDELFDYYGININKIVEKIEKIF
ncbi:MAG TPA: transketolase [Spirochaetia bacterium]|nr:MAG: transketolase [Spirochaetes bacterium GWB1_36_13]HCL56743.1 transketolase [Spirochaetia bacterium]